MNPRIVLRVNAGVVLALGLALLAPLTISFLYEDGSWVSFLLPAAVMGLVGGAGMLATRPPSSRTMMHVSNRDVYLSVTLAWVLAAVLGGVPFFIEGTFGSLLDSTFEGMSGFTTTGATLLSEVEAETPSILFWRGMTQWLGGIGIVVLFVAIAPTIGLGAARLLGAEGFRGSAMRASHRASSTPLRLC
ncbi:MAG TPA: potassium transporter TrkG [Rubrobacteraceae bacterium]|nr:potassium transporter TrkG [Rubrobacteraceae bacterium]